MAIDVFCYATFDSALTNKLIRDLKFARQDFFANDFILNSARDVTVIHNEIASEAGFSNARSIFLMHLSNKNAATKMLQAAEVVREYFGDSNILLLLENERRL